MHCESFFFFTFRCHRAAVLSLTFLGTILTNHFLTMVVIDCSQVPAAEIKWKLRQATGVQKNLPGLTQRHCVVICPSAYSLICHGCPASQINVRAAGSHPKLWILLYVLIL